MNNSKKKAFFNVRLYLEGIRQLKIVGIMGAIIMAGAAFLIPMGDNIENANYESYINGKWVHSGGRVLTYSFFELNPLVVATFLLLTPLMVMVLFHFLNKRNACDFYHAVPETRTCLFFSYGSSVLTWNAVILLLSYVITVISGALFRFVTVDYSQALVVFAGCIVACIYMFGVFAIAMSVTGTVFTNLAVAAMILAVPRTIVTIFVFILNTSVKVLPFSFSGSILDDRLNIVTNLVTGPLVRGDLDGLFQWQSVLYTVIVGVIYCAFGLLLFRKRKSEAAASAAVSARLQCAFRQIPAILISLIPLALLIDNRVNDYEAEPTEYFWVVVLYLIAVLAYFLYELITTRKLKNLLKAIPGLLWLALFNVVFYGLFFVSYHAILNDIPETSDVKYVNIDFVQSYSYRWSEEDNESFYAGQIKEVDIDSDEIKELLLSELERNVNLIKEGESVWSYNEYPSKTSIRSTTRIVVEFHTGFGSKTRVVYVSPEKMAQLLKLLEENEQIADAVFAPIQAEQIQSYSFGGTSVSEVITQEEVYDIYLAYVEDMRERDKTEAYYNILVEDQFYANANVAYFNLNLDKGRGFSFNVGVDTPKALRTYLRIFNEKTPGQSNLLTDIVESDFWKKDTKYVYYNIGLSVTVYPKDYESDYFYFSGEAELFGEDGEDTASAEMTESSYGIYDLLSDGSRGELAEIAERIEGKDRIGDDSSGNILCIQYWENYRTAEQTETTELTQGRYYMIDDETMELLRNLY